MSEISVVIPAYNGQRFVGEAIRSALAQSVSPAEVIVVDDGSTDATADVVRSFGADVTLLQTTNGGSGRARNLGFRRARCRWIAFLDADDTWVPDKLARQLERAHVTGTRFNYCGKLLVDEDGRPQGGVTQRSFPEGDIFPAMVQGNYISSSSCVLIERQTLEELNGFEERPCFRNSQDYEMWLRVTAVTPVSAVAEPLVLYRVHDTNVTKNVLNRHRGHLAALDSALGSSYWARHPEIDGVSLVNRAKRESCQSYAMELWRLGMLREARARALQAIRLGARDVGTFVVWSTSFLPPAAVTRLRALRRSSAVGRP